MFIKTLGEGTFGIVQQYQIDGRDVAVKRLKRDGDQKAKAMFEAEREVLGSLQHRHIIRLDESWQDPEDPLSFGMEYLPGDPLKKLLIKQMQQMSKPLYSFKDALRWSAQLASAMRYLHEQGIIFRDLSADNVLLTATRTGEADIKLIDFGLHRRIDVHTHSPPSGSGKQVMDDADLDELMGVSDKADQRGVSHSLPERQFIRPNDVLKQLLTAETGSYTYMSPEVTMHQPYDERTDIFALGCLIYELFARQLHSLTLFTHQTGPTLLLKYSKKVALGYRPAIPGYFPEPLAELIRQCWAQDAADRLSAAQVEACLVDMARSGCLDDMGPKSMLSKILRKTQSLKRAQSLKKMEGRQGVA